MTVREKISHWLKLTGTPQKAAARSMGIAQSTLNHFLDGNTARPTYPFLLGAARMMGTSVDWLIDEEAGWPVPAAGERGIILSDEDQAILDLYKRVERLFGPGAAERRLMGEPAEVAASRPSNWGEGEPLTRIPRKSERRSSDAG